MFLRVFIFSDLFVFICTLDFFVLDVFDLLHRVGHLQSCLTRPNPIVWHKVTCVLNCGDKLTQSALLNVQLYAIIEHLQAYICKHPSNPNEKY